MPIISIAAYSKGRVRPLQWSRQFVPIQKSRLDAMLFAFPKLHSLRESNDTSGFITSHNFRYVYYTVYDIHFVALTSMFSNLTQDTATLQLAAKLIYTICNPSSSTISSIPGHPSSIGSTGSSSEQTLKPEHFKKNIFEIFFALDELVEYGGLPSEIGATIESIQTSLLMDSHEEHRYNLQQAGKLKDAKLKSKERAAEIDRNRKLGGGSNTTFNSTGDPELDSRIVGIGSGSMMGGNNSSSNGQNSSFHSRNDENLEFDSKSPQNEQNLRNNESNRSISNKDPTSVSNLGFDGSKLTFGQQDVKKTGIIGISQTRTGIGGIGGSNGPRLGLGGRKLGMKSKMILGKKDINEENDENDGNQHQNQQNQVSTGQTTAVSSNLLQLNQQSIQSIDQRADSMKSTQQQAHVQHQAQQQVAVTAAEITVPTVKIEEQIQFQLDTENTIKNLSIQGKLSLCLPSTVTHPNYALQLNPTINGGVLGSGLKLQTRPGLDKNQWQTNHILYNTDPNKQFNLGGDKPNVLVQWRLGINQNNLNTIFSSSTSSSPASSSSLSSALITSQFIPFTITHWVSPSSTIPNGTTVSIEVTPSESYKNSDFTPSLQNIIIAIPCPSPPTQSSSSQPVVVSQVDKPWKYDSHNNLLLWSLGSIFKKNSISSSSTSQNQSNSIDFTTSIIEFDMIGSNDYQQNDFLPLVVKLQPVKSFVGIFPVQLYDTTTSQPITDFGIVEDISIGKFEIVEAE